LLEQFLKLRDCVSSDVIVNFVVEDHQGEIERLVVIYGFLKPAHYVVAGHVFEELEVAGIGKDERALGRAARDARVRVMDVNRP
jgi:hypothetical protein